MVIWSVAFHGGQEWHYYSCFSWFSSRAKIHTFHHHTYYSYSLCIHWLYTLCTIVLVQIIVSAGSFTPQDPSTDSLSRPCVLSRCAELQNNRGDHFINSEHNESGSTIDLIAGAKPALCRCVSSGPGLKTTPVIIIQLKRCITGRIVAGRISPIGVVVVCLSESGSESAAKN